MMTLNRDHAATTDHEAVAKNVEAFRLAQIAADPKALGALCADDLSYSHSSGFLEDKAAFIANATDGKTEFLSITYKDPIHQDRWSRRDRALPLVGRDDDRRTESGKQPSHPDELAEARRRVEVVVALRDEVVIAILSLSPCARGWLAARRRDG
ncbi:hypothetical protein ACVWZR_001447 [Bradyrhizobium sp. i1.3.1]